MWNWQDTNWPNFRYHIPKEKEYWESFTENFHTLRGASMHFDPAEKQEFSIDILSHEAFESSRIEGEHLSLESLQSSLQKNFGIKKAPEKSTPKERGIAKAFEENYTYSQKEVTHNILFDWNSLLLYGQKGIIEEYRKSPIYIVSRKFLRDEIHYEGVPHTRLSQEMDAFLDWFRSSKTKLSPLIRASIAHLYFASIHPFEDGNGRISRMLAEKCLSESLGQPALLPLSLAIQKNKHAYYAELKKTNRSLEISSWIDYFSQIIVKAQEISLEILSFTVQKKRFYEQYSSFLNPRQEKVIARILQEGVSGFSGGLSTENYLSITKTSRATAVRDMNDLLKKNIFVRRGEKKGTRYFLKDFLSEG